MEDAVNNFFEGYRKLPSSDEVAMPEKKMPKKDEKYTASGKENTFENLGKAKSSAEMLKDLDQSIANADKKE